MIEGTRVFRRKSEREERAAEGSPPAAVNDGITPGSPPESRQTAADAMDRREAMAALGPQLAKTVVRFFRSANSLRHELEEEWKRKP